MNNIRSRLHFQSNKLKSCQALYPFDLSLSLEKRFFFFFLRLPWPIWYLKATKNNWYFIIPVTVSRGK